MQTVPQQWEVLLQAVDLEQDISMALGRGFRIIQLDECVITKRTLPTHVWTLPRTNAQIDQKSAYTKSIAVILAVSREYGMDHVQVFPKSINKTKFKVFLQNLRAKFPFDDVLLVMDNL